MFSVDCSYGEWSAWGSCTLTCGDGTMRRTRAIVQHPLNGGVSCTEPLGEVSHCGETCPTTTTTTTSISTITTTTSTTTRTTGPSKFIMVTTGDRSPYVPHFFSLSPEKHPLPSCLKGTKQALGSAIAIRYNAALFPGEGMYHGKHNVNNLSDLRHERRPGLLTCTIFLGPLLFCHN